MILNSISAVVGISSLFCAIISLISTCRNIRSLKTKTNKLKLSREDEQEPSKEYEFILQESYKIMERFLNGETIPLSVTHLVGERYLKLLETNYSPEIEDLAYQYYLLVKTMEEKENESMMTY